MPQTTPTPSPITAFDFSASSIPAEAREILDYWFADGLALGWPSQDLMKRWFTGGPAVDDDIQHRFGALVGKALGGGLTDWEVEPAARLALIILLDQFTRNVHRGSGEAFKGDARAQSLVLQTLDAGEDSALPPVARVFLYMPLEHAENLALQARCVACFTRLLADAPQALRKTLQGNLDFAVQHQKIIQRFGRFPHRNQAMGRASTAEEIEFLVNGPRFGQ